MNNNQNLSVSIPKNSSLKVKPTLFEECDSSIGTLAFDPLGKFLAVGEYSGAVKLYNPESGKVTLTLIPEPKEGEE